MNEREIRIKKHLSDFFRDSAQRAKQKNCALCGAECSSFSNSHSVPQFVMKRIAVQGKFVTFSDIVGLPNSKNGINNTWTFHVICSKCENHYFKDYEQETVLLEPPSNKIMAEIALKNSLLMLHKYRIDRESNNKSINLGTFVGETDVLPIMNTLDIENTSFDIKRSKKIIDNNLKSGYHLVYYNLLDWVTPMAFQGSICVYRSFDGKIINQIYSESKNIRMQQLHVTVFPLKEKTAVMMFFHKDDRNYIPFERQFHKMSDDDKLQYINYLIFKYTEHMMISPRIDCNILKDNNLLDLCEECTHNLFSYDRTIGPSDIPNFLSPTLSVGA